MLGTIMAANVFFVIIPAHWELVRAKQEGREPDPGPACARKQRSVHNNYLTLPVVFTMLAGHFPLAFGHATRLARPARRSSRSSPAIRHFFNLWHVGRRAWWILGAAAAGAVALAIVLAPTTTPASQPSAVSDAPRRRSSQRALRRTVPPRRARRRSASSSTRSPEMRAVRGEIQRQVSAERDAARQRDGDDRRRSARPLVAWAAGAR